MKKEMGVKKLSFALIGGFINARVDALETVARTDYDGVAINYTKTSHLDHRYIALTVILKDGRFLR